MEHETAQILLWSSELNWATTLIPHRMGFLTHRFSILHLIPTVSLTHFFSLMMLWPSIRLYFIGHFNVHYLFWPVQQSHGISRISIIIPLLRARKPNQSGCYACSEVTQFYHYYIKCYSWRFLFKIYRILILCIKLCRILPVKMKAALIHNDLKGLSINC